MAWASKSEPCIPIPMIPNRTRSLGATGWAAMPTGAALSHDSFTAIRPPAAIAPLCKNPRRVKLFFMPSPSNSGWFTRSTGVAPV